MRRLGCARLPRAASRLDRGAGALLARGGRRPRPRVLAAVGARAATSSDGPEWAKWFVGGAAERRLELRPPLGGDLPDARPPCSAARTGRARRWTLRRAVARGDAGSPRRSSSSASSRATASRSSCRCARRSRSRRTRARTSARCRCRSSPASRRRRSRPRLEDSEAKVVICADWSLRRGKRIADARDRSNEANATAPSVEHVRRVGPRRRALAGGRDAAAGRARRRCEVDSEHPYLLAYTSGTTGRPKGALHVHGGFLVSIAREVAYQADVQAGRPRLLRDRHGLDHGPVDRRRRRRGRRDRRSTRRARRTGRTTGSGRPSSRSA